MKPVLVGLSALVMGSAALASIDGTYSISQKSGCVAQRTPTSPVSADDTYSSVEIQSLASDTVKISLGFNESSATEQTYICDSKEHAGDGYNTGDRYTATCAADSIHIRRVFSQLKYPLVSDYKLTSSGLELVETFDGDPFTRTCDFDRH